VLGLRCSWCHGSASTDEVDKGHLIGAALLLGSAYGNHRAQVLEKSLATRIGNMLASDDPAVLRRGAEIVARSERLMDGPRRTGDVINPVLNRGAAARVAYLGRRRWWRVVGGSRSATCEPSALLSTEAKRTPALLNCSETSFSAWAAYAESRCCGMSLERGGLP
jgi:hypothetical protein